MPPVRQFEGKKAASTSATEPISSKISCLACRAAKRKCFSDSTLTDCRRCQKQGLVCQYKEHHRGRRPTKSNDTSSPTITLGLTAERDPSSAIVPSLSKATRSHDRPRRTGIGALPDAEDPTVSVIRFSHVVPKEGDSWPYMRRDGTVPTAGSPVPPLQRLPPEDSREHLVLERLLVSQCPDPIQAGLLSHNDAVELFDLYFSSLNLLVPILDPALCQPARCQAECPLLFTAVLTITAKVLRPRTYRSCLLLANKLIGQAVEQGLCSVAIVQAIQLLVHFKEPEDNTGWSRIGFAIRLAYELRLNIIRTKATEDEDPEATRRRLNRERTWLNLLISDYHMAIHHSLPRMILDDGIEDVDAWLRNHVHLQVRGESILPALVKFSRMCRLYADLLENMNGESSNLRLLAFLERKWHQWRRKYVRDPNDSQDNKERSEDHAQEQLQSATLLLCDRFFAFHIAEYKLLFRVRYQRQHESMVADIRQPTELSLAFHECVEAAMGPATVFGREYVAHDLLPYASNILWVALAVTAVWLIRNVRFMTSMYRQQMFAMLENVQDGCRKATRTPADLAAYMYRLLQHLMSAQDMSLNRADSTTMDDLLSFTTLRPGEETARQIIQDNLWHHRPSMTSSMAAQAPLTNTQLMPANLATDSSNGTTIPEESLLFPSVDDEFWKFVFPVSDMSGM